MKSEFQLRRKVVHLFLARPRKDTSALQGAYTKEAMKDRLERENRLKGNKDNIMPPDFIEDDEIASRKFNQLKKELTEVDVINNVDADLLAVYSDCWSKFVKTTKILNLQDFVEEQENKSGANVKTPNPYIKIQQSYSDRLVKLSSLFGLSPADRSKIAHLQPSDKNEKKDPLLELLQGLKKK